MARAKIQVAGDAKYTKDMTVELTHQISGKKYQKAPYRDGTATFNDVESGRYRVQVRHKNMPYEVYDDDAVVYEDRQTFVPIKLPKDIFENAPIADTPEADLGPIQEKLDEAQLATDAQAKKIAGQPIYAADWNVLANVVGQVAHSTKDLTDLVSPVGHDHPELVAKFEEVQRNMQRMYDAFGQVLAELQRQIQQMALQSIIDDAVDKMPNATPEEKQTLDDAVKDLTESWNDKPSIYGSKKRRAGQKIEQQIVKMLEKESSEVAHDPEVEELMKSANEMSKEAPAETYEKELIQQNKQNQKSKSGTFHSALKKAK